jgi:hypothetical protein
MKRGALFLLIAILPLLVCPITQSYAKKNEVKIWMRVPYGYYNSSVYHVMIDSDRDGHRAVDTWIECYCADASKKIRFNTFYWAEINTPPDDERWRAINYIMTWFHKIGNYTGEGADLVYENSLMTPEESRAIGQAIWYFTNEVPPTGNTSERAWEIIDEANGKDLIRENDALLIDLAEEKLMGEGCNMTFTVRVLDGDNESREGVKLIITVVGGRHFSGEPSGPYSYEVVGWTDGNGEYNLTIVNPTLPGETYIDVWTMARFVNILNTTELNRMTKQQPLITLYNHTYMNHQGKMTIRGSKYGYRLDFGFLINVIPEFPIGTILPLITCIAAITIVYLRKGR